VKNLSSNLDSSMLNAGRGTDSDVMDAFLIWAEADKNHAKRRALYMGTLKTRRMPCNDKCLNNS
jgi:hypothetical protein